MKRKIGGLILAIATMLGFGALAASPAQASHTEYSSVCRNNVKVNGIPSTATGVNFCVKYEIQWRYADHGGELTKPYRCGIRNNSPYTVVLKATTTKEYETTGSVWQTGYVEQNYSIPPGGANTSFICYPSGGEWMADTFFADDGQVVVYFSAARSGYSYMAYGVSNTNP